jgi:hypothetical protein
MSQNYLDKFHSSLPKSQGNQILKRLVSKRDSGEIRNVEEFKSKLQSLTQKILEERITPNFNLIKAIVGTDISSEEYNEMLNRIYDDLETAFVEADNMDEIIDAHHNLINTKYLNPSKIQWLSNTNSVRSELNVSYKSSNLNNIIDNTTNTFWIQSLLFQQKRPEGVPMELAFHFGATQDINFIEIEPACPYSIVLVGIDYYEASNTRLSTGMASLDIIKPTRINFERISTNCIILRFTQKNSQEIQFIQKKGESNFDKVLCNEHCTIDQQAISEDLNNILTSDFILSEIFNPPPVTGNMLKYQEYIFGFDNIRLGYSQYKDKSIYVSTSKTVEHLGRVGLKVEEIRPVQHEISNITTMEPYAYPPGSTGCFYHSSVEYWLGVQHFADHNFLISTEVLPILPLGAQRIHHESLIFTRASSGTRFNAGSLRFFTEADSTNVIIYRNNVVLTPSVDWDFVDPADPVLGNLTIETAGQRPRMRRGIKVLGSVNPLDIYTVSYTPTLSNTSIIPTSAATLAKVVDLTGDQTARLISNNIIVFSETKGPYTIHHSKLYLIIIMRRNSANEHFSPAVEEYMLVTGAINSNRFQGI